MAEKLIELRDITKSYGNVYALGGVNLHVDRGEVVGLIGDNGAGKSTLIKILAGVVKPTSGEILVRGKPVTGWNAARSRDAGIETVFQDRALAVQQTDRPQHLHGPRAHRPRSACSRSTQGGQRGRAADARDRLHLEGVHARTRSSASSRAASARASPSRAPSTSKADLIILDEPTTALSLTETAKVFHFVRQVRASGRSILFIGHNIHHVFDIADRFVVLDRGTVALEATDATRSDRPSSSSTSWRTSRIPARRRPAPDRSAAR